MKVYIQSNKYQFLAANVAKYSFERFGLKTEVMNVENNEILIKNLNKKIKRNNKISSYKDDLQSFTLLRFFAPKLDGFQNKILVIDPDIFALRNPIELESKILGNGADIVCTFYNNLPRSEMMLINAKKISWDFDEITKKLFDLEIDYSDLMNLKFDPSLTVMPVNTKYNSHDKINDDTILLHTTNRITQPWKLGLQIDFERHLTKSYLIKQKIKKIFSMPYNKAAISNNYFKHENEDIFKIVGDLFKDAYNSKFITKEMIKDSIKNKFISQEFCEINELI